MGLSFELSFISIGVLLLKIQVTISQNVKLALLMFLCYLGKDQQNNPLELTVPFVLWKGRFFVADKQSIGD